MALAICVVFLAAMSGVVSTTALSSGDMQQTVRVDDPKPAIQESMDAELATYNIAILGGNWWTDDLWLYLDSLAPVSCSVLNTDYDLATLQQYDAVIIYGNMYYMHDTIINQYVQNGGGLIATPWAHHNEWNWDSYAPPACLPVTGTVEDIHYDQPVDITFFNVLRLNKPSDTVGYERGLQTKAGAFEAGTWNDGYDSAAVSLWTYGEGKAVYLNMQYITSDCDRAIDYDWGKTLMTKALKYTLT